MAEKKVFAHYMVCCPTRGSGSSIEDYKEEIKEAQKRGIDGFALNCGGWEISEPHYKERAMKIYEAAQQLETGFELFVSADGAALMELADIVASIREHPSQLLYEGKPVVSTFGGEGEDNSAGRALIKQAHGLGAAIMPFFYPRPQITEHPLEEHAVQLLQDFPGLDGYFYFGAAGTGEQISASNAALAKKFNGQGKLFIASVTPFYRGNGSNFRLFETQGFQAMALEWEGAIRGEATWVELVTWNDWNESSYLAPYGPVTETNLWDGHFGPMMLSHVAYLDASRFYIDWFKKGSPPSIEEDKVFYFYRLHPKALMVTVNPTDEYSGRGYPEGVDNLLDRIFVTAFLKSPAQLIIKSGDKENIFDLGAGVTHVSSPFASGFPHFVLKRESQVVLSKSGEHEITSNNPNSRFNYFGGSMVE